MIRAVFQKSGDWFKGFEISGHAGYAGHGRDIVCASVSSAVMLTANAVTEVAGIDADVRGGRAGGFEADRAAGETSQLLLSALKLIWKLSAKNTIVFTSVNFGV
ncbi:MAG: ribosomal-processing cysteine protease Prp [Oscillospiraceae bacterium]